MAPKWKAKVTLQIQKCDFANVYFHIVFTVQNSHGEVQRETRKRTKILSFPRPLLGRVSMMEFFQIFMIFSVFEGSFGELFV